MGYALASPVTGRPHETASDHPLAASAAEADHPCPAHDLSAAIGLWQIEQSRQTAKQVFDRSLLTTALAIVGDVDGPRATPCRWPARPVVEHSRRSGLLPLSTRPTVSTSPFHPAAGHAHAQPGYRAAQGVEYFDVTYNRRPCAPCAFTMSPRSTVSRAPTPTLSGSSSRSARPSRGADPRHRPYPVVILVALALCGLVRRRRRPAPADRIMEEAISRRGSDDLRPIRRTVPAEVRGLVRRLNVLFGQVTHAMDMQRTLIFERRPSAEKPDRGYPCAGRGGAFGARCRTDPRARDRSGPFRTAYQRSGKWAPDAGEGSGGGRAARSF